MQNVGSFSQHHRRNIPSHDYRRTMCDEKVYWKWGSWSCDRNGMSGSFEVGFFPAWHVLLCRATNARNARANKGWNASVAGSGQVIPKGCHAPNEAWERKYTVPIDIILTFIRATWMRWDRREIRIPTIYFLKFHSRKYYS